MLLRLACLGVANALALQRQLHGEKVRFTWADRAWLAAVLHRLPREALRDLRLLVRPETVLRWRRDLIARRHARSLDLGSPPATYPGVEAAASTVRAILRQAGIDPAAQRTATTWATLLQLLRPRFGGGWLSGACNDRLW